MDEVKRKKEGVCNMCHLIAKLLEDIIKHQIIKFQILMRTWKQKT